MAPRPTLNAKNLEALGAAKLAELLIEISTGNAAAKRRLRLELAGNRGSSEVAHEVRKRLGSIARAKTRINWRRVKAVKTDLDIQRRIIVEVIANDDPQEAFALIWQFLGLANAVMERASDSSASLIETFHQACFDAANIAHRAGLDADDLTEAIVKALQVNDAGQFDPIIETMSVILGQTGLHRLKDMVIAWRDEPDDRRQRRAAQAALQRIADLQGDVDAYIAELSPQDRRDQAAATDIGRRLLSAGRASAALAAIEQAEPGKDPETILDWQMARLEIVEALGRDEEAQADRWSWFEGSLTVDHLRSYLRRLPDFDDVEAEENAFAIARTFPDVTRALAFFIDWPAHIQAARMVIERRKEFDGDDYELLSRAAETLCAKYPIAATILRRQMIDFTLERARSTRYKHAARHLTECAGTAGRLTDLECAEAHIETHQAYFARIRERHGKKTGFWKRVELYRTEIRRNKLQPGERNQAGLTFSALDLPVLRSWPSS